MHVAQLTAPREFRISETADPAPSEKEVLVRVRHAGICGSDLHFYEHGRIGGTVLKEPFVMGHEFSGILEDNRGIASLPPNGTRVAVDPAHHCGECPYCRQGRPNICPNVRFTGFPPYPGAYSEFIAVSPECIYPIPDTIPDEHGPLLETLAVAVHALEVMPDVRGKTCAVLGAGTVGLLVLSMLLHKGANVVLVTDPIPERRETAKRIGCPFAYHPGETEAIQNHIKHSAYHGPELIFEAAGEPESFQAAIDWSAPGGRVAFIGIYAPGAMPLDFTTARRNELETVFVRRSLPRNYPEAIQLASEGHIDLKPLVSHTFPLREIGQAFHLASERTDGVIKTVLQIENA